MGKESADAIQAMLKNSNAENNGPWATLIGVGTLLLTASRAFDEIQSSLNKIWKAEPKAELSRLVRARIAGLGLVMTLAFLMIVSLVVSAGLAAFGTLERETDDPIRRPPRGASGAGAAASTGSGLPPLPSRRYCGAHRGVTSPHP